MSENFFHGRPEFFPREVRRSKQDNTFTAGITNRLNRPDELLARIESLGGIAEQPVDPCLQFFNPLTLSIFIILRSQRLDEPPHRPFCLWFQRSETSGDFIEIFSDTF